MLGFGRASGTGRTGKESDQEECFTSVLAVPGGQCPCCRILMAHRGISRAKMARTSQYLGVIRLRHSGSPVFLAVTTGSSCSSPTRAGSIILPGRSCPGTRASTAASSCSQAAGARTPAGTDG
jgi:hypothetical protein